ncbi:MAG TPA: ArsR family transcriptional regulator [Nitrososphaeraceae archaeon]|nr:ArsR family transcriptional regulator [Nitrososphaeraceae archaeon]
MTDTELIYIDFDNPDLEYLQVASQSTRLKILNTLTRTKKMYASNLAQELGFERKIISFHLNALENVGLVKSEFGLTEDKRPAAVRYYEITPKGTEILEKISEMLKRK